VGGGGALTAPVSAASFVDRLFAAGFDFFAGVPCSLVGPVIAELDHRRRTMLDWRMRLKHGGPAMLGIAVLLLGGRAALRGIGRRMLERVLRRRLARSM